MRVLFLDTALTSGVAIDDAPPGQSADKPRSWSLRIPGPRGSAAEGWEFGPTFAAFEDALNALITEQKPDMIGLETPIQIYGYAKGQANTVMILVTLAGLVEKIAWQRSIPCRQLAPSEIKRHITGNGTAKKLAVRKMVEQVLRWDAGGSNDRADAMAGWAALKAIMDPKSSPYSTPLFTRGDHGHRPAAR